MTSCVKPSASTRPSAQQHGPLAEPLDGARVVRDEDDGAAAALELEDLPEALALEGLVADREDLVEEEDLRPDVRRDREAEAHVHARRIRPDGQVDEALELRERDDLVHRLEDLSPPEAVDGAGQKDVLAAGEVGVEAGAELEQRADGSADGYPACRRLDDPGDEREERRLPGAVPSDEPDRLAGFDSERHVSKRPDVGAAGLVASHDRVLQREPADRAHAVASADAVGDDLAGSHALSVVTGAAGREPQAPRRRRGRRSTRGFGRGRARARAPFREPRRRGPRGSRGGRRRSRSAPGAPC